MLLRKRLKTHSLWATFSPIWFMWVDQVKCVSRVIPRHRAVLSHWIGAPEKRTGQCLCTSLLVLRKRTVIPSKRWWRPSGTAANAWRWRAASAGGMWLRRPCHPRRQAARRGRNVVRSFTYRLKRTGNTRPPWATPLRMLRMVDVAEWWNVNEDRKMRFSLRKTETEDA